MIHELPLVFRVASLATVLTVLAIDLLLVRRRRWGSPDCCWRSAGLRRPGSSSPAG